MYMRVLCMDVVQAIDCSGLSTDQYLPTASGSYLLYRGDPANYVPGTLPVIALTLCMDVQAMGVHGCASHGRA